MATTSLSTTGGSLTEHVPHKTKGSRLPTTDSPFHVAVLDDYQNLSAAHFSSLPNSFKVTIFRDTLPPFSHPRTTDDSRRALIERLKPFAIICSMRERTPFPRDLLAALPNLEILLTTGMRNASIDLVAAKELGIKVSGTKNHPKPEPKASGQGDNIEPPLPEGPDSTTQHCVALVLSLVRNVAADDLEVKSGGWQSNVATSLSGKTFGCVGFGRLGVEVARIMYLAFGMRIIAWSSSLSQEACDEKSEKAGVPKGAFRCVSKEALFKESDVVSVHYVLSSRSKGIVGKEDLALMKKEAFLVNTSRGPLIDEEALLDVCRKGSIRGVALDVYEVEPLEGGSAWRSLNWGKTGTSKVLLSPHMGYVDYVTMDTWYKDTVANIVRYEKREDLLFSMIQA